jgi:hypothetical protein
MNLTWRRDVAPLQEIVRLYLYDLRHAVAVVEKQIRDFRPDLVASWTPTPH